jgi:hypothetical protein
MGSSDTSLACALQTTASEGLRCRRCVSTHAAAGFSASACLAHAPPLIGQWVRLAHIARRGFGLVCNDLALVPQQGALAQRLVYNNTSARVRALLHR